MAKVKIESQYLRARFGHGVDYGFTSVPNLILDHMHKLGFSDFEVYFVVQIIRAQYKSKAGIIKDSDLSITSSVKTMYRFRKKLQELKDGKKHLVLVKSLYTQNEQGKYIGHGTEYDFRPLYDYLISKYEEPTGPGVRSAKKKPTGLRVQGKGKKGKAKSKNSPKSAQPGPKVRYLNKNSKKKEFKTTPIVLFLCDGWEFYSDMTVAWINEPNIFYPWDKLPRGFDMETMDKMDKFRSTGEI